MDLVLTARRIANVIEAFVKKHERLSDALSAAEKGCVSLQTRMGKMKEQMCGKDSELANAKRDIASEKSRVQSYKDTVQRRDTEIKRLTDEKAALKDDVQAAEKTHADDRARWHDERSALEKRIESSEKARAKLAAMRQTDRDEISRLQGELTASAEERGQLIDEFEQVKTSVWSSHSSVNAFGKRLQKQKTL